jgi:hypothetical protein
VEARLWKPSRRIASKNREKRFTVTNLRRLVMHLVSSTMEQEYGSPARLLTAWYGQDASKFGGLDLMFPGRFEQILAHLARGLDIRLSTEVAEIAPGHVHLVDGSRIAADRVVCKCPSTLGQSSS